MVKHVEDEVDDRPGLDEVGGGGADPHALLEPAEAGLAVDKRDEFPVETSWVSA